jgi:hypothetical protein
MSRVSQISRSAFEPRPHVLLRESIADKDSNLVMLRRHRIFKQSGEFLREFFARSHAGKFDLDIFFGPEPRQRIRCLARSTIFTGWPMSRTQIWPPLPIAKDCSTSWQASGIVIKKRRISGCVTVTGPPAAICFLKIGITLPFEPSTLPKRTATYFVRPFCKRQQDQLGDALRRAHHVCRPDSLVRRNQQKVFDAMLCSRNGDVVASKDVVFDGLKRVSFH